MYNTFRFLRSQIFAVWSSLPVNLYNTECLIVRVCKMLSIHTQVVIES